MKKALQIAYLAGIFDGEGCITSSWRKSSGGRRNVRPEIYVSQAYRPTLEKFRVHFGGDIRECHPAAFRKKTVFRWRLVGFKKQLFFLRALYPYLGEKRKQARLVIYYLIKRLRARKSPISEALYEIGVLLHRSLREAKSEHYSGNPSNGSDL